MHKPSRPSARPLADNRGALVVGGVLAAAVIGYALFAAAPFLSGPALVVTSPQHFEATSSPVLIQGTTERVAYLTINDQLVPLAEDGSFSAVRAYPPGYTVVVVRARDRFDREIEDTITLITSPTLHVAQDKE